MQHGSDQELKLETRQGNLSTKHATCKKNSRRRCDKEQRLKNLKISTQARQRGHIWGTHEIKKTEKKLNIFTLM